MTKSTALKAYRVDDDEYTKIRFATCNAVARREGACELGTEFEYVSCRRAPEFDSYAAIGEVPVKALVEEHGWWLECRYCNSHVYDDVPERVWESEQTVYCSVECQARQEDFERDCETEKAEEASAFAAAVAVAYEKFPGITNAFAQYDYKKNLYVYFRFPGGQWNVSWLLHSNVASPARDDADAFRSFISGLKKENSHA